MDNVTENVSAINKLEIKNFKSVKHISLNTSRVNIFIGRPNSGKSNLLEALTLFNFIQAKQKRVSESAIIRYNTLDNLFYDRNIAHDIEINYNANSVLVTYYSGVNAFFQIINPSAEYLNGVTAYIKETPSINEIQEKISFLPNDADSEKYSSKVAVLNPEGATIAEWGTLNKENPIRRYEFRDGVAYGDLFSAYLKTSGGNLYTIVQGNPDIREWINSFFEEFGLEFLIDFSSRAFEIQKKERGIVYKIPFELTPDTFRRMLFHIAAIYSNKNTTILLEEPESHSFPPYIKELSEKIKADTSNKYFITTHSPYFINSMVEDSETLKDISFFNVYYEDYQTKIKHLTQKDLDNVWGNGVDIFFNIDALDK